MNPDINNYKIIVEVFKGYLDTALTANIWFYALTGAVVSYYLSNRSKKQRENIYLKYSLFLPIALGGLIIYLSWQGKKQACLLESVLVRAGSDPKLDDVPSVNFLANFLDASMIL